MWGYLYLYGIPQVMQGTSDCVGIIPLVDTWRFIAFPIFPSNNIPLVSFWREVLEAKETHCMSDTWRRGLTGGTLLSFFPWLTLCTSNWKIFFMSFYFSFFFYDENGQLSSYVSLFFSWQVAAVWHAVWILKILISRKHPWTPFLGSVLCQVEFKTPDVCQSSLSYFENPQTISQKLIISSSLFIL